MNMYLTSCNRLNCYVYPDTKSSRLYISPKDCYNENRYTKTRYKKAGDYMTGKEIVKLIRKLKEKEISSDEILAIIEYIETHDPKEQEV